AYKLYNPFLYNFPQQKTDMLQRASYVIYTSLKRRRVRLYVVISTPLLMNLSGYRSMKRRYQNHYARNLIELKCTYGLCSESPMGICVKDLKHIKNQLPFPNILCDTTFVSTQVIHSHQHLYEGGNSMKYAVGISEIVLW